MGAAPTGNSWLAGLAGAVLLVVAAAAAAAEAEVVAEPDLAWRDPAPFGVVPGVRMPRGQVVADLLRARERWQAAAERGDPRAQHNLAVAYASGPAPLRDERAAAGWYRRAAEQGFVPAQLNLGRQYWLGLGVERDLDAAAGWWRAAMARGSDAAALNLVLLVEAGWNPLWPSFNTQFVPAPFAPPRWPLP